ncbi:MAG: hypothetical protein ACRCVJ_08370 [Clostridium sp.]|uniref:hypothetical protein n=1 Tax=Clostridium sp. TaxID=1506 RepID=UPI003F3B03FC
MINRSIIILMPILVLGIVLMIHVFVGAIVYRDAKNIGANAVLWTAISVLVPGFIGILLYIVIGRNERKVICNNCKGTVNRSSKYCGVCGIALESYDEIKKKPLRNLIIGLVITFIIFISIFIVGVICFFGITNSSLIEDNTTIVDVKNELVENIDSDINEYVDDNFLIDTLGNDYWELKCKVWTGESEVEILAKEELIINSSKDNGKVRFNIIYENGDVYEVDLTEGEEEKVINTSKNNGENIKLKWIVDNGENVHVKVKWK